MELQPPQIKGIFTSCRLCLQPGREPVLPSSKVHTVSISCRNPEKLTGVEAAEKMINTIFLRRMKYRTNSISKYPVRLCKKPFRLLFYRTEEDRGGSLEAPTYALLYILENLQKEYANKPAEIFMGPIEALALALGFPLPCERGR